MDLCCYPSLSHTHTHWGEDCKIWIIIVADVNVATKEAGKIIFIAPERNFFPPQFIINLNFQPFFALEPVGNFFSLIFLISHWRLPSGEKNCRQYFFGEARNRDFFSVISYHSFLLLISPSQSIFSCRIETNWMIYYCFLFSLRFYLLPTHFLTNKRKSRKKKNCQRKHVALS